jgi:hypothetical protein
MWPHYTNWLYSFFLAFISIVQCARRLFHASKFFKPIWLNRIELHQIEPNRYDSKTFFKRQNSLLDWVSFWCGWILFDSNRLVFLGWFGAVRRVKSLIREKVDARIVEPEILCEKHWFDVIELNRKAKERIKSKGRFGLKQNMDRFGPFVNTILVSFTFFGVEKTVWSKYVLTQYKNPKKKFNTLFELN